MTTVDQSGVARAHERSGGNRAPVQLLDGGRLLTFLDEHADAGSVVRRAIYEGAAARVRRGDFNVEVQP